MYILTSSLFAKAKRPSPFKRRNKGRNYHKAKKSRPPIREITPSSAPMPKNTLPGPGASTVGCVVLPPPVPLVPPPVVPPPAVLAERTVTVWVHAPVSLTAPRLSVSTADAVYVPGF